MPIAERISTAASTYRQNEGLLAKSFEGLSHEEWLRRPSEPSNPMLWIVGHIVWGRSRVLALLGEEWTRKWLPLFARGAMLGNDAQYPAPEEVVAGLDDVAARLATALEEAAPQKLTAPVGDKSPSYDGTLAGMITYLAFHETYHVGQTAYLRCWLGHDGIVG